MLTNLANKHGPTKTRKQRVTLVKTGSSYQNLRVHPKLRNLPQHRIAGITTGFTHQFVETVRQELVGQKGLNGLEDFTPRWRWNGRLLKSPAPLENNVLFFSTSKRWLFGIGMNWNIRKYSSKQWLFFCFVLFFESFDKALKCWFFCWGFNTVVGKKRVNKVQYSAFPVQMITNKSHSNICTSWNWDGLRATFEIDLRYSLPTIQELCI